MALAVERLEIALQWNHGLGVNCDYSDDDLTDCRARAKQRLARARKAYFARMAKTPQRNWVVIGEGS
jgi:hypothetical protein